MKIGIFGGSFQQQDEARALAAKFPELEVLGTASGEEAFAVLDRIPDLHGVLVLNPLLEWHWVVVGYALGAATPVMIVGNYIGLWADHPLATACVELEEALEAVRLH